MNISKHASLPKWVRLTVILLAGLGSASAPSRADVVQMVNGDRYAGTVISVMGSNVVFQSDVQGRTVLPRDKVASIYFRPVEGALATTNQLGATASGEWLKQLRNSSASSNLVEQVRRQLLAGAGPEANQQFDEMVRGLMGGTISMDDIRRQAQESVNQLRAVKNDLGEDGEMLEGYLKILEGFLQKADSTSGAAPPAAPK